MNPSRHDMIASMPRSLFLFCCLLAWPVRAESDRVDFNNDIRPILSNKCFACHGPDQKERQGGVDGLRLDTAEGMAEDLGDGSRAVVPGDLKASRLYQRVTTADEDERMPPPDFGKRLSSKEIALLRKWIQQGAEFQQHWSYVPPRRPALPEVSRSDWPRTPIDHFILYRMERAGLAPSEEADRSTLIRRVSLDLTGLPPTWEELESFLADDSERAYEALVDRLLASEGYGEHMARMWLDLARYADSAGYADDPPRTIWAYRDYLIRSFNENKPFDQFTIEQLAGDLLPQPTEDQLIATAFHRNTLTNNEGGTSDEEFRNVAIVDRVNTTMAVWMGTTMACAQCHSHKYDPISQKEYFQFFALLNNTQDADRRDESPVLEIYTEEQRRQKRLWTEEIAQLKQVVTTATPELLSAQQAWEQRYAREPSWTTLVPDKAASDAGQPLGIQGDGSVRVDKPAEKAVYSLDMPIKQDRRITALRLEALPDEALPDQGPGFAQGNFVITQLSARVDLPEQAQPVAKTIRVELPGKDQILSLAEVQVFSGGVNIAPRGQATQSSTDYDGPAQRAIDGNTDGDYVKAKSTTHTARSSNPWWQVELAESAKIDRIVIWNRTDNHLQTRLKNFRIKLLSDQGEVVWEHAEAESPNPSQEFSISGPRSISFGAVFADYTQNGFQAADVTSGKPSPGKGWAIGGRTGARASLVLVPTQPVKLPAGSILSVEIEQQSQWPRHVLGRFRLSVTDEPRVSEFVSIPPEILAILKTAADDRTPRQSQRLTEHFLRVTPLLAQSRARLASLEKQLSTQKPYTTVPILRELPPDQRRTTRIQIRGNYLQTGEEVGPGVPVVFGSLPEGMDRNRLALAHWLVSPDNPLTARVFVNRLWEKLFGAGLVRTSEEFGSQGDLPSHPQLLDWLAVEFVESGWDVKHMLKLMVMSAVYRQSSLVTPEGLARDPQNRFLARGPRFRLTAEMVRDQSLAVSGLLSRKMYGPPIKPPQPNLGLSAAFGSSVDWKTSTGEDRYRRALYITWRRSSPYPSMSAFDAPNREVCTLKRDRTNTPLQAFVTLNDPVYVEAAQALARRIAQHPGDLQEQVRYGFRLCLSREPSHDEAARLASLFEQMETHYKSEPEAAKQLATKPLGELPEDLAPSTAAAWTVVANVLLNLDEMLMKR